MVSKAAADNGQKMVAADCVSVLLVALGNTSISKQQLEMMSALDGSRTVCSFEHQFRSIIAKAKELKARFDSVEAFQAVPRSSKRGPSTPASNGKKRKTPPSDSDADSTPSKKRATPKARAKKQEKPAKNMEEFPDDAEDFIKNEAKWEQDFA
ncbi:hypothetical protein DDE82_007662 [Stemphylium lycopersici]|uniref:Uncharacterized protein n=1 Tax=Stemphylium lycopersici TaxID=183478 RepID=A0A364NEV8_STELY|nr:hypothetical protein TW65_08494 [Stemphylium lycopersici]RAR00060.1 hypothetical protein DDE82_007662 [Stemphylium lycopersici]RAR15848.1 hypothetical protein DDE83_000864 [Stemphylium lycopersici]